jgi:NAD+ synthase
VDLLPIGDLLKSDVRAAAKELGVPDPVIDKPPSAGTLARADRRSGDGLHLRGARKLSDQRGRTVSPALAMRIERLMRTSEHKRAMAPTPGGKL